MIQQQAYKIQFVLLFLLFNIACLAQSGITAQARVDKSSILIGEHITLTLKVDIPENEAISFFEIDTIPHFEFLDKPAIDTTNTASGTLLTQVIRITSFDSGHWVIPAFVMADSITTDSIPVDVGYSEFDRNQEYHDIKDILDVEVKEQKEWWYWAAGGGLLVLLVLLYFLLRKKPAATVAVVEPEADPYEEAVRRMTSLQKNKPSTKEFYSVVVDVFRLYVHRKKGVLSQQKTTDDLVVQLKSLQLPKDKFDRLAQALRLSDFVKFAKYQPERTDDDIVFETIRETIEIIEKTTANSST